MRVAPPHENLRPYDLIHVYVCVCFFFLLFYCHSETNCLDTGLLIEVWNKGLIWDKALGHYWLPLHQVPYSNEVRFRVYIRHNRSTAFITPVCRPSTKLLQYSVIRAFSVPTALALRLLVSCTAAAATDDVHNGRSTPWHRFLVLMPLF